MTPADPVSDRIFTVPNLISMVRLLMVPVVLVLILQRQYIPAVIVLVIAGVSDWLDGVIARRFNQMSQLGKVLDPIADRLFIAVTLTGMAIQGLVTWWVLAVIIAREAAVGITIPILARRGYPGYPVHFAGKAGTSALMYAFPLLLIASLDNIVGEIAAVVGWAAVFWGIFLYWYAGVLYLIQFKQVMRSRSRASHSPSRIRG